MHSLGEYLVPMLVLDMNIESVIHCVYKRGLAMIKMREDESEDEKPHISYGMASVDPSRIGKKISDLEDCLTR